MEIMLYIISAIISHFAVECFIQKQETRSLKFEDKKVMINYSIGYSVFVSVVSIIMMSGIGIVYLNTNLFILSVFTGIIYYALTYIAALKVALVLNKKLPNTEKIYVQWFMNINFILMYLLILNLITQL